jgi:hypothetical protein
MREDPAAYEAGSQERARAEIDLIRDILRMIGIDPDEGDDYESVRDE